MANITNEKEYDKIQTRILKLNNIHKFYANILYIDIDAIWYINIAFLWLLL